MVNTAIIVGRITKLFKLVEGTNRSESEVMVLTNKPSFIPVSIDDKTMLPAEIIAGKKYRITGTIRSWSEYTDDGKRHNHVHIHATSVERIADSEQDQSYVHFQGRVIISPHSIVKGGKDIAQTIIRIKLTEGRFFYIPVVAWSGAARYVSALQLKQEVDIVGSLISRPYIKYIDNTPYQRVTHEVVISRIIPIQGEHNA